MPICFTCAVRKSLPRLVSPEQPPPRSSDVTSELKDLNVFAFNLLLTLLSIPIISGSEIFLSMVLALLFFTVSLRLAVNPCFIQNYPTISKCLHAVPLLGTFCMMGVGLILDMQSPTLAVVLLSLGVLSFVVTIIFHGRRCEEMPLPSDTQGTPPTVNPIGIPV